MKTIESLYPPGRSVENSPALKRAIDDSILWGIGGVRCFVRGPQTTSGVSEAAALMREMRRSSPVVDFCDTAHYSDMPDFVLSPEQRRDMNGRLRESTGMDLSVEELTDEHLRNMHRFAELLVGKLPKPENHT